MAEKPVFLRGRGRGRGWSRGGPPNTAKPGVGGRGQDGPTQRHQTAWNSQRNGMEGGRGKAGRLPPTEREEAAQTEESKQKAADEKFEATRQKYQEAAKKHLMAGDLDLSDEEEEDISDSVLGEIFKSYTKDSGGDNLVDLDKAQGDLLHNFRSGTSACLVCIETIKKEDPIWNCEGCCGMFHIQCVQRWVKEGVYQQVYQNDTEMQEKEVPWYCPKCRHEYKQWQCPTRYWCFCGKTEDPKFDPWLVPHSCGQTCGRRLKPNCGHECLLLCHPGACPSCPQTLRVKCYCGKSTPQTRRCSARTWACGKPCGHLLSCGHHRCEQACHPGECAPCPKTSRQTCQCGKGVNTRPCASPSWQCDRMCGKSLSCGHHTCEKVCHPGSCGPCPRAGQRSCPCGKTKVELPCTEDVPTCVDTCGKELDCGSHLCTQRCHTGPCGACRQMITKRCRCGQRQKEVPCYKEFLCETRCTKLKDCHRHQCKRKCCDGNCPPCEQQCNKALKCRNHKCASRCHRGPCYPCTNTVNFACFCKATSVTVPCGRGKNTRPPRCNRRCQIPPDCHHPSREKHRCHFGDCPPCRFVCKKSLTGCTHICPAVCHTAVRTRIQEKVARAGPWVPQPQARVETLEKPCPPCQVPVPVSCRGKHEVSDFACSEARPYSCHRQCGRQLPCGNHTCTFPCHVVEGDPEPGQSGDNCEKCENQCVAPRPEGCEHRCLLACHPDRCPPCKQRIRMRCHCKAIVQHIECCKWHNSTPEARLQLQSCGGECPRLLSCGHSCGAVCHDGKCSDPKHCQKKVNVRCACRRKKKDFQCKTVQAGLAVVSCDDVCAKEISRKKQAEDEAEKIRKEAELKKQAAELEEFERKVKGKKKKVTKRQEQAVEVSVWQKHRRVIVGVAVLAVITGLAIVWLINL